MNVRVSPIAIALSAILAFSSRGRADDAGSAPSIPLNQEHAGTLDGNKANFPSFAGGAYQSASTVQLLGGHSVSIQMHVVGSGRLAAIAIYDSTGALLGNARPQEKANALKIDELSYTGKYTVCVGSDRIGDYIMRVQSEENETAESVQAKIDSLKAQLADLEEKLKSLKAK